VATTDDGVAAAQSSDDDLPVEDRLPPVTRRARRLSRRAALAGLATGLSYLAGCGGRRGGAAGEGVGTDVDATATATATRSPTPAASADDAAGGDETSLARQGVPSTICETDAQPDPGIYAVVDPAFGDDWAGIDVERRYRFGEATGDDPLPASATVVGLRAGDRARAYPLAVVWWHEVVNDEFGGPTLVTYCPICRTGTVTDRVVDGEPTRFLVSGHLWQAPGVQQAASVADGRAFGAAVADPDAADRNSGNLVLVDDATGTFWSQVLARAICGPRTGERLPIRPSTVTTWGRWRDDNPDTDVLLPPPHSGIHRP
jgi:hypothetical protein